VKLQDKDNQIELLNSRVQTLEQKFSIYSREEVQNKQHKLMLEAELIKMASRLKDLSVVQNMHTDLSVKSKD